MIFNKIIILDFDNSSCLKEISEKYEKVNVNLPPKQNSQINNYILSTNENSNSLNEINDKIQLTNRNNFNNKEDSLLNRKTNIIDDSYFKNNSQLKNSSAPNNIQKQNSNSNINLENLSINSNINLIDCKKIWTKEEDEILINFVKSTNSRNWKKISSILKTKTPQQCSYRFNKIYTLKDQKKFTRNEDILIIELIEKYGHDWNEIINHFPGRKIEELSERYFNKLNPSLKKRQFEPEEDTLILKLHNLHGNNWNEISKYFKDASVSVIKNRYYSHLKKKIEINNSGNNSNNMLNNNRNSNNFSTSTENNYTNFIKNNYTNSYSENSEVNSYEINVINNIEQSSNTSKSYEPMNYKTRQKLTNELNNINFENINDS